MDNAIHLIAAVGLGGVERPFRAPEKRAQRFGAAVLRAGNGDFASRQ